MGKIATKSIYKQIVEIREDSIMKKVKAIIGLVLVSAVILCACGGKTNNTDTSSFTPVKIRFANQHPTDSIASEADRRICAAIEKATEGRVTVDLYTDSSLGDYTSTVQELMMGTIEMCHISAPDNYDPKMTASMLPYLGSNYEELKVAYDRDGVLFKGVYEAAQKVGIHSFGIFCEGFSGVGTAKEIKNPKKSDTDKGTLIRVPSLDSFALATRRLGFRTSTIAYTDTYTAIQTGTVNGWMGGPPNLNYLYFRDVIKYYYHYMITQEATQIMMNEQFFQKLLPQDQEAITKIIQEECDNSFEIAKADDQKYMDMMAEKGIQIIEFTDEERAAIAKDVRENVWPELAKNMGEDFLEDIKDMLK